MRQRMVAFDDDGHVEVPRKKAPKATFERERDPFRESKKKQDLRKTRQLCGQVAQVLHLCLPFASDLRLEGVHVVLVRSMDAARLEVVVSGPGPVDQTLAALMHARPWFRQEVSDGIHRKRTPELLFSWQQDGL
ncbi:MAG: ribosome-binding factor A [Cognaticolwellia sp.]|jgi:ribosome-binding factor A